MEEENLYKLLINQIRTCVGRVLSQVEQARLLLAMSALKERSKTLLDMVDEASFLLEAYPIELEGKAVKLLSGNALALLAKAHISLSAIGDWNKDTLSAALRDLADSEDIKLRKLAQPLRAALTGRHASPGIFEVLYFLGREESLKRISDHKN